MYKQQTEYASKLMVLCILQRKNHEDFFSLLLKNILKQTWPEKNNNFHN